MALRRASCNKLQKESPIRTLREARPDRNLTKLGHGTRAFAIPLKLEGESAGFEIGESIIIALMVLQ